MRGMKINTSIISAAIIASSCIWLQYRFWGLNLAVMICCVIMLFQMIHRRKIQIDTGLIGIVLCIFVQQVASNLVFDTDSYVMRNNIIHVALIVIAIFAVINLKDKETCLKAYIYLCLFCGIIVLIQTVLLNTTSYSTSAIRLLPQKEEYLAYWFTSTKRACAFFTEPQIFCTYVTPALVLTLEKRRLKSAVFLTGCMILTGSSLGIAVGIIVWIRYVCSSTFSLKKRIVMVALGTISALLFLTMDLFEVSLDKLQVILEDFDNYANLKMITSSSYSNYMRILKGWTTLFEMPTKAKILGTGMSNFVNYMVQNGVYFSWNAIWDATSASAGYYSSIAGIFIECGIPVGLLYYVFLWKLYKRANSCGKMVIALMVLQSVFTQFFMNGVWVFYMFIYYMQEGAIEKKDHKYRIPDMNRTVGGKWQKRNLLY